MDSFESNPRERSPGSTPQPAERVRRGVISGRVLTVLLTSVILTLAALFIAWLAIRP